MSSNHAGRVRGGWAAPLTVAVALTGFGMERDISEYKLAGFDAQLIKPVNFQKLETIIHQLIG